MKRLSCKIKIDAKGWPHLSEVFAVKNTADVHDALAYGCEIKRRLCLTENPFVECRGELFDFTGYEYRAFSTKITHGSCCDCKHILEGWTDLCPHACTKGSRWLPIPRKKRCAEKPKVDRFVVKRKKEIAALQTRIKRLKEKNRAAMEKSAQKEGEE